MPRTLGESVKAAIDRAFRQQEVQEQAVVTAGAVDGRQVDSIIRDWNATFSLNNDRISRYNDFEQMDVGDISVILDAVVEQALTFEEASESNDDILLQADCFKVDFEAYANRAAKKAISDVIQTTKIREELPEICRDMVKNGDEYVEILWQDDEVVGIQPHFIKDMFTNRDNKGRIMLGVDEQGNPMSYQQRAQDAKVIAGWWPYQMLQFKLYPSRKRAYSRKSFLDTMRYDWKKLSWLEQGMVLARTSRAYPRLVWQRDMTGKTTKDAESLMHRFMLALTRKKTNSGADIAVPMAPDEDYFMSGGYISGQNGNLYPRQDKIELLDPQLAGLGAIADVIYLRRKLFSIVPSAIVGIFDSFQSDMTPQDIALARFVKHIQSQLEVQLRLLFDRALMARGIDPQTVTYKIIWPRTTIHTDWRYSDGRFRNSMADQNYNAMDVISKQTIRMREFSMTTEESTAEEEQIQLEKQQSMSLMPTTNSGQGQGDGSGNTGKTLTKSPKSSQTISKQRTAGNNSGPKPKQNTKTVANESTKKTRYNELREHHAKQLQQIQQFAPADNETGQVSSEKSD